MNTEIQTVILTAARYKRVPKTQSARMTRRNSCDVSYDETSFLVAPAADGKKKFLLNSKWLKVVFFRELICKRNQPSFEHFFHGQLQCQVCLPVIEEKFCPKVSTFHRDQIFFASRPKWEKYCSREHLLGGKTCHINPVERSYSLPFLKVTGWQIKM